jgi:hypothetical protein
MAETASPGGGLGISLINVPESLSNIPYYKVWIVDRLAPSKTTIREIAVHNTSDKPITVSLYPGAATNVDGSFSAADQGVESLLTKWTTISPSTLKIPAHSSINAKISIVVPADAVSSSEYGVIWAANTTGTSGGITQVNRIGIRMYTPVGDGTVVIPTPSATPSPSSTGVAVPPVPTSNFLSNQDLLLPIFLILFLIFVILIKNSISKLKMRKKKVIEKSSQDSDDKLKLTASQFLYLQDVFKKEPPKPPES